MRPSVTGLFVGLILGLAYVVSSFGQMLIVAVFGVVGFVIAKIIAGELDVATWVSSRSSKRS